MQISSSMDSLVSSLSDCRRFVCIHGHFYQPPRENPWLESVPIEDSAAPFDNWNLRIDAECFRPNSESPILNAGNRVTKILNNYAHISFNFGPTLLSWMEESAPSTYAAILGADQESARNFSGHGSALAQAYNHVILGLATRRDKEIQIAWGIRDFERRFGRYPEGFWLPETAVDLESLQILENHGIKFTILAPHQAVPIVSAQTKESGAVDTRRPYRLELGGGRHINLFLYDGPLSQAVAFEQLLHDGKQLAARLLSGFSEPSVEVELSHIATDGETYGHHHRHGEMALAFALETIRAVPGVRLTNYGEFLELFPPDKEVRLVEGSSWSCSHGIERWRADCGCNSGSHNDWNQKWRVHLRDALRKLAERCVELFQERAGSFFPDPETAVGHYGDLVASCPAQLRDNFLSRYAIPNLDLAQRADALRLLDMRRNCQLMFTSCGWFFDEISGIEPVQILCYAARAIQLARQLGEDFEADFLDHLSLAQSNLPEKGDGRQIYLNQVLPVSFDSARVAFHAAFLSLFEVPLAPHFPAFEMSFPSLLRKIAGDSRLCAASIYLERTRTAEESRFAFLSVYQPGNLFRAWLQPLGSESSCDWLDRMQEGVSPRSENIADHLGLPAHAQAIDFETLSVEVKRAVLAVPGEQVRIDKIRSSKSFLDKCADILDLFRRSRFPLPPPLPSAVESILKDQFEQLSDSSELKQLAGQMFRARDWGVDFSKDGWPDLLVDRLVRIARDPDIPWSARLDQLISGLGLATELGVSLNLWQLQCWLYKESRRLDQFWEKNAELRQPIQLLAGLLLVELPEDLR